MTSNIDFRTLPNYVPALCIPRVFPNWSEKRIRNVFNDLSIGDILRIDIMSKTSEKGEKFNRVLIYFDRWYSNPIANMTREKLLNGKEIKILYDDPWFWKVSAYTNFQENNILPTSITERPRASIQFYDDTIRQEQPRPKEQEPRPKEETTDIAPTCHTTETNRIYGEMNISNFTNKCKIPKKNST